MPHPSSDELLIARLFDLPAEDRTAFWQRACTEDPSLPGRHPEFARLFSQGVAPIPPGEAAAAPLPADAIIGALAAALGPTNSAPGVRIGPMADVLKSALGVAASEAPGVRIGHYKLLQKIGEGGFGAVWMAEQLEPIRRRVAMKIVKVGMDTEEVIARFEVERQALALMDHPNIARVFDAGATASGRPYFVMELVRGVAITRYCDENRLPAEDRLRLFVAVCQAVQHAHQKGIIHRDLKPSNILVTVHDGTPVPKVIDFGIAKATDKQLTEKTLVTQFHAFVGTPAYTSPEQMEMSGLDVDTRSDIYSLGVLLYELLAGRPPFDPDALIKSGLEAMRRTIREIDPPRPSSRLGTLNEADRTSVAHARSTDAAKLSLLLRGDVDWIVMHCLEKDRTRRYETANALARDVQRHLAHEPVAARPPSTLYRAQKLFRRHKLAVTAAAAVAVSLIGGLITSSTLFVRERAAHQRAAAAEKSEEKLRQEADAARAGESLRASRTSLELAEQRLSDEGRATEGIAHLVRAARSDLANLDLGPRLVSALAYRNFAEPIGEPLRHPGPLWRAFYTKDGRHCVSIGQDSVIRYWSLAPVALIHSIVAGRSILANINIIAVDVSADGTLVAAGDNDGNVNAWNLESGRKVVGPLRHEHGVNFVHFSPDGRLLAVASNDNNARIWDLATGESRTVLSHEHRLRSIRFSPDGTRVITATARGPWRLWRGSDGEPMTPPSMRRTLTDTATSTTFSPDGTLVAITDNSGAQLFDAFSGAPVGARMVHSAPCYGTVFTRDGKKLVTTSDDGTARVWEVPTGRQLLKDFPHGARVHPPLLSIDDRSLITRCDDGIVRVWDLFTGRLQLEPIRGTDGRCVDVSSDGSEVMAARSNGEVRRWRIQGGAALPLRVPADTNCISVTRTTDPASIAWAFYPDRIQKIDLVTGKPLGAPRSLPAQISAYNLAWDGSRVVVRVAGNTQELWDLRGPEIVRRPLGRITAISTRFSPQMSRFAIRDDGERLHVWNTETAAVAAGPFPQISGTWTFSRDDRRVALAMTDSSVVIWDLEKNHQIGERIFHQALVQAVQFSPDGRFLATASQNGIVQIWDTSTIQSEAPPFVHRSMVRSVGFSHDGRRVMTCTASELRVWDAATGTPLTDPMIGGSDVYGAGFMPGGARIAAWSRADQQIRIWSSTSGQLLADPMTVPGSAGTDVFRTDTAGRFLSLTAQRGLVVWSVPVDSDTGPIPDWLLRVATLVAAGEIDGRSVFRERIFEAKDFEAMRDELSALPDNAPYVEWGRWILADRSTRPIAPGFKISRAEADRLAAPGKP